MIGNLKLEPNLKFTLKHKGESLEEQVEKNKPAIALLQKWLEEEVAPEEAGDRENYWQTVKEIIDSERPSGFKLYSQE
ncbi:hypothetical protein BCD67_12875 [Oscillatoriales cyanobacterium USR001]|nr:hypothetical protein BCD67_12875 [Oscillatoriales cyanobacterium USR001]